jgi:uncharacterized protein (DUF1778 family)
MPNVAPKDEPRRDAVINLRASPQVRALIDRAAKVLGKTRSEFMLDSARQKAEDVLLDQHLFVLDEKQFAAFMHLLDEAPKPSVALKKLMRTKAPWQK